MAERARLLRQKMKKELKKKEDEEKKIIEEKKKEEEKKFKFKKIVIQNSDDEDSDEEKPVVVQKKEEEKVEEKPKEPEPVKEIDPLDFFERPSLQIEVKVDDPLESLGIKLDELVTKDEESEESSVQGSAQNSKRNSKVAPVPDKGTAFGVMKLSLMDIMGAKMGLKANEKQQKEKEEKEKKEKEEKEKKEKEKEKKEEDKEPKKIIKTLEEKNKEIMEQLQLESQNPEAANEVVLPELQIEQKKALFKRLNSSKRKVTSLRIKKGLNQDLSEIIVQKIDELKKIPNFNSYDKIQIIIDKRALAKYIFENDDDVQKINDNDEPYPEERKTNIDLAFIMKQTPTNNIKA